MPTITPTTASQQGSQRNGSLHGGPIPSSLFITEKHHDVDDYAKNPKHRAIHRMGRATRSVGGWIDKPALPQGRRKEGGWV